MNNLSIQSLQAKLAAEHKRNELAIQAANLGTWDWNLNTGEVIFNELFTKMLGYAHHEVKPHMDGWLLILHPDDVEKTTQELQKSLDGTSSFYLNEHRLKTKAGTWLWVQARGRVIEYSEDGKPQKHTSIIININDLKIREEQLLASRNFLEQEVQNRTIELRASEEKFSNILQLAPEGILTTTSDGIIQLFNEGAQNLFGYSEDEIIGQNINVLIDNTVRDKHLRLLKEFKDGPIKKIHMAARSDIKAFRKDGSSFFAKISISKVGIKSISNEGNKDDVLFAAIIHDISELTNSRDKMMVAMRSAELANRAKTDFLANMSHELRTPLNAIIGYAQLIEQEVVGPIGNKSYRDYADAIHVSGLHLLSLIQDILDISRIEAKKQDLREEALDLTSVTDACIIMVRQAMKDADIQFTCTIEVGLPRLFADEKSLKQIFINLLSNATKFTPNGGKVTLNIYLSEAGNIICEVSDTGVGLHEDDIPKIFLPFTQVVNQDFPLASKKGTGLGLAIVKSFVDLYKAEIIIDSKPDVGTCVRIIFPSERTIGQDQ